MQRRLLIMQEKSLLLLIFSIINFGTRLGLRKQGTVLRHHLVLGCQLVTPLVHLGMQPLIWGTERMSKI